MKVADLDFNLTEVSTVEQ